MWDFRLCERFGWTIEELGQSDSEMVAYFIEIMTLEAEKKARDNNQSA